MTNQEIQAEFAALSSIGWDDYCELCSRDAEEAMHFEARRAGRVEDDEAFDVPAAVVENHWAYGGDYGQPRIGTYQ